MATIWRERAATFAECRRQLAVLDISVTAPEVDGLPLLTRLLLFAADAGSSLADVCTVAMIGEEMIRSEAEALSHRGVIELDEDSGRLTLSARLGRRLWNDFTCVRMFRKARYRLVFDPLAEALRWVVPSDLIQARDSSTPLLRNRIELVKLLDHSREALVAEISPSLAAMFASHGEDSLVNLAFGAATGTLDASLPLPSGMVFLPRPHTAINTDVWRFGTDSAPPPDQLYAIDGPALRFEVLAGRQGQRSRDIIPYLFDQCTGVIHKEIDIQDYVRAAGSEPAAPFMLPRRYEQAALCEALASGLLAHLLPERGRNCGTAGWSIGEQPVTLRRGATEGALAACAACRAQEESGWHVRLHTPDAQDSEVAP
jgi:hypothetical protein